MKTTDYKKIIPLLVKKKVKFIIVGGVAAAVHGSVRNTFDLDVVYARDPSNIKNIVKVLAPYSPYLRDAPPNLPFILDEKTLKNGLNFTLTTTLGNIDLLGEISGGGRYEDLIAHCEEIHVYGVTCLCVSLEKLLQLKRAVARPKDFEIISELEAILEERKKKR